MRGNNSCNEAEAGLFRTDGGRKTDALKSVSLGKVIEPK